MTRKPSKETHNRFEKLLFEAVDTLTERVLFARIWTRLYFTSTETFPQAPVHFVCPLPRWGLLSCWSPAYTVPSAAPGTCLPSPAQHTSSLGLPCRVNYHLHSIVCAVIHRGLVPGVFMDFKTYRCSFPGNETIYAQNLWALFRIL